jgi:hypothetical protein
MGGQGTFHDPRIGLFITQTPDLVTPKLPALLDYQLSLRTPERPKGSINRQAANRGKRLFRNEAGCGTCHQWPHFTDVLSGPTRTVPFLHDPAEVGTVRPMPCGPPPGRRRYGACGSIRRISMMGVHRIPWRWSITMTSCLG